jgi:hypothetical protein
MVEDVLYLYSERSTVKARNLESDPRVVIHLERGADVVIVHGRLVDQGRPTDHPVVVDAFDQKYHEAAEKLFLLSSDPVATTWWRGRGRRGLVRRRGIVGRQRLVQEFVSASEGE